MEGPGHGRARGRARGIPAPQAPAGRGEQPRPPPQQQHVQKVEDGADSGSASGENRVMPSGGRKIVTRGAITKNRMLTTTKPVALPTKKGVSGTKISRMTSNYFRLIRRPEFQLTQYHVDFSPDVELTFIRKGLMKEHKTILGGYIFDGTALFLTIRLPNDHTQFRGKRKDGSVVLIDVKIVGVLDMQDCTAIQLLNLIIKRAMEGLELQLVGRNLFDAKAKINISEFRLELWPGYITSIRQHENDLMLCAEITHKVMRNESCYKLLIDSQHTRNYQTEFSKLVIGTTVLTDYNNKTYKVDDVDYKSTPLCTFDTKDGPITYVDYYQKKYSILIKDKKQPMLISRAKARDLRGGSQELIVLVPELCRATGFTDEMRNNFRLMKTCSDYTRLGPRDRIQKLLQFNQRIANTKASSEVLIEYNMDLSKNLVEVEGRLLNAEKIFFGDNREGMPKEGIADWTHLLCNNKMQVIVALSRWVVIFPQKHERDVTNFIKTLIDAARGLKYPISEPNLKLAVSDDRQDSYLKMIQEGMNIDPQLLMLILPKSRVDLYSAIKKRCCVDRPIPTQVMLIKTITPKTGGGGKLMSVASKVAIQINCKLGGAAWMVQMPLTGLMTIGFDVSHNTKDRSKSVGAMVASMDLKVRQKFFSAVALHSNGEELCNELISMVRKALLAFRGEHNKLPSRILFYRDGVGDGQIEYVYSYEVQQIKKMLEQVYKDANEAEGPKFTFIIVSKRINTRIFVADQNPKPGTVVDNTITLPERYDFFLVSQSVRQGTVSPTAYNIVHDTMGLSADKLQIMTYKMCHLYYNWSGTTRVPAVVQYAHKLADLVGQYIHQPPSNLLEKQLYFL